MVGLAFGNLFAGPISDASGRKKPLLIAMIIFTLASLGIIFVTNIWIMIALRLIQGLTGGAGAVISRAIASDMYSGNDLTKFLSLLMLVNGVAPVIRQHSVGNLKFCHLAYGFIILTVFGLLMFVGTLFKVPESRNEHRANSNIGTMFKNFKDLFATPRFVLPMLIQGVSFILLFTYISASPFIVQKIYGLSPFHLASCSRLLA